MTRNNTTPFLLNLDPGEVAEPDITSNEFLDTLGSIGVWLRVLSAFPSVKLLRSSGGSSAQRLSAVTNLYIHLGAQAEDHAVALVAFSAWAKNRNLSLPDLFSRIFVKAGLKSPCKDEINAVHGRLLKGGNKSVHVDQKAFFLSVSEMSDPELVEFFLGYRWRKIPSVKLIPKGNLDLWQLLPGELRRIVSTYAGEGQNSRLFSALNKLKHGPQLIVQNPIDRARLYAKSGEFEELEGYKEYDRAAVRVLFSGARVWEPEPPASRVRSLAPFLLDGPEVVSKIFFETMVHEASIFQHLVRMHLALYRQEAADWSIQDDGIWEVLRDRDRYKGW